jgi:hypothetical protein
MSFHLSFCVTAMFLTILIVATGIFFVSSLILNQNQSAIAQQQQPQASFTSAKRQKLMEGISFVIDNVTFSHHVELASIEKYRIRDSR